MVSWPRRHRSSGRIVRYRAPGSASVGRTWARIYARKVCCMAYRRHAAQLNGVRAPRSSAKWRSPFVAPVASDNRVGLLESAFRGEARWRTSSSGVWCGQRPPASFVGTSLYFIRCPSRHAAGSAKRPMMDRFDDIAPARTAISSLTAGSSAASVFACPIEPHWIVTRTKTGDRRNQSGFTPAEAAPHRPRVRDCRARFWPCTGTRSGSPAFAERWCRFRGEH